MSSRRKKTAWSPSMLGSKTEHAEQLIKENPTKSPYAEIEARIRKNSHEIRYSPFWKQYVDKLTEQTIAELKKRDEWMRKALHHADCAGYSIDRYRFHESIKCTCGKDSLCGEGE